MCAHSKSKQNILTTPDPTAASDMKQNTTVLLLTTATSCLLTNGEDGQKPAGSTRSQYLFSSLTHKHTLVIVCLVPVKAVILDHIQSTITACFHM